MPAHSFLGACRKKAAEELEIELQEAEIFDDGADVQEANSLRKQAAAWLSAALPWAGASKEAEAPKQQERGVRHSLTPHPDDLQEVLREFEGAYDRLWNIMTDINTDLMLMQGLQSGDDESSGLARNLRAVDESHAQYQVLTQAAGALSRIREADQDSLRALGNFHQELERLLACEVWCSQEAVVALEKAKERMDVASTRLKVIRNHKDKKQIAAAKSKVEICQNMYKDQAAIVEELLPEVLSKIDGAIASGLSNYLRAQHRRFRAGCSALEELEFRSVFYRDVFLEVMRARAQTVPPCVFETHTSAISHLTEIPLASLPTLDAAAEMGLAGFVQRRLITKRRRIAEQDGQGGSLHRMLASPADNFAVEHLFVPALCVLVL